MLAITHHCGHASGYEINSTSMIFQTRIINYEEDAKDKLYTFLNTYGAITQKNPAWMHKYYAMVMIPLLK